MLLYIYIYSSIYIYLYFYLYIYTSMYHAEIHRNQYVKFNHPSVHAEFSGLLT